jgi:hypothetical protein
VILIVASPFGLPELVGEPLVIRYPGDALERTTRKRSNPSANPSFSSMSIVISLESSPGMNVIVSVTPV